MMSVMKIWISDEDTSSHRIVGFNLEQHSDFTYLGDLNDEEVKAFLKDIKEDLDIEQNLKMLKYFGYLHILAIKKAKQ